MCKRPQRQADYKRTSDRARWRRGAEASRRGLPAPAADPAGACRRHPAKPTRNRSLPQRTWRSLRARRTLGEAGAVDGWGLLHALLADAADDLLVRVAGDAAAAAAAAADAWQLVGALADEPMRGNAMGAPPGRARPCSFRCHRPAPRRPATRWS